MWSRTGNQQSSLKSGVTWSIFRLIFLYNFFFFFFFASYHLTYPLPVVVPVVSKIHKMRGHQERQQIIQTKDLWTILFKHKACVSVFSNYSFCSNWTFWKWRQVDKVNFTAVDNTWFLWFVLHKTILKWNLF